MTHKYIKLNEPLKTSISNLKDLYDKNGQWLHQVIIIFLLTK